MTVTILLGAGVATAAYSGTTRSGEVIACFLRSDGALRIVDHFPCKSGEQPLRWNSRGAAGEAGRDGEEGPAGHNGTDGKDGLDGKDGGPGADGAAGPTGAAGRDGADGTPGTAGPTGAPGPQGEPGSQGPAGSDGTPGAQGPAGADGARGSDGAAGPAGPQGPQGPAGPAGNGSSMQFGQVTNNSDPDCAMVGPVGRTTGASCNFTAAQTVGEYLPSSVVVSGFRVLLDRTVSTPTDIIARAIDPNSTTSVDAFALCTVPAGSNTCGQTGERTLSGPNLFMLQFSGNRSWTNARFGYSLVQA
jgi:hypothetical protein